VKDFSRKTYNFSALPLGQKLVYSSFLFFVILGWMTMLVFYAAKSGLSYETLLDYYRGNEEKMMYPKTFLELWEITHSHLFIMPLVFLVLIHLFMLTRAAVSWKVGVFLAGTLGMILDIGAPWLIVYVSPVAAWLKIAGRILLNGSLFFTVARPLAEMWARPKRPRHKTKE
jgi:hypothetical protein